MSSNTKRVDLRARFEQRGAIFSIRAMQAGDVETLRRWKNAGRKFFSHKDEISPEQQAAWYEAFAQDPTQQMFVCIDPSGKPVACVGFRSHLRARLSRPARADELELFNLICGDMELRGTGLTRAFYESIETELARQSFRSIYLCVLKDNDRAIAWYEKRGYERYGDDDHTVFLQRTLEFA